MSCRSSVTVAAEPPCCLLKFLSLVLIETVFALFGDDTDIYITRNVCRGPGYGGQGSSSLYPTS